MSWIYLINVFCAWLSWRVADRCEPWGGAWMLNMAASSLNAVIVLRAVI